MESNTIAVLPIIKYSCSILSAAYGVLATVTDFKIEKDGKMNFSKDGLYGLAVFMIIAAGYLLRPEW